MSAVSWSVLTSSGSVHAAVLNMTTPESLNRGVATDRALSIAMNVFQSWPVVTAADLNTVSLMMFCRPESMSAPKSSSTPSASALAALSSVTCVSRPSGKSSRRSSTSLTCSPTLQLLAVVLPFRAARSDSVPLDAVNTTPTPRLEGISIV